MCSDFLTFGLWKWEILGVESIVWRHKLKVIKLLESIIGVFENAKHTAESHGPVCFQLASNKEDHS